MHTFLFIQLYASPSFCDIQVSKYFKVFLFYFLYSASCFPSKTTQVCSVMVLCFHFFFLCLFGAIFSLLLYFIKLLFLFIMSRAFYLPSNYYILFCLRFRLIIYSEQQLYISTFFFLLFLDLIFILHSTKQKKTLSYYSSPGIFCFHITFSSQSCKS